MSHADKRYYYSLLSNLLIPLGGLSTDIYLPSLPAMSTHFAVSRPMIQLTITFYVLAMGLGQLVVGPISDALGRRRLILGALTAQVVAIIGILLTNAISMIFFLRFIQGLAMAFMMVPARAIINDVFTGVELRKQFAYITISFAIGPIIAPYLGGYLQYYCGWQANFYGLLLYSVLVFVMVVFTLPETIAELKPFQTRKVITTYHHILQHREFVSTSVFAGMVMVYSTLFSIIGPFIIQTMLNHTSIVYGRMALLIGLAWLLGNMLNRLLINIDYELKIQLGLLSTLITIVVMLVLSLDGQITLIRFIAPTFIMVLLSGFLFGITVSEGLSMFAKVAASANACLFSIVWLIFFIITVFATFLHTYTLVPIAMTFLLANVVSGLMYLVLRQYRKHSRQTG